MPLPDGRGAWLIFQVDSHKGPNLHQQEDRSVLAMARHTQRKFESQKQLKAIGGN
jgi:hypothetical protein